MDQISEECDLQLKRRARKGVNRPVKSRERREQSERRETAARRCNQISTNRIIYVHQTNLQIHNKNHHQWRSKTMKHE